MMNTMAIVQSFIYRNNIYRCEYYIDNSEFPCLIFVLLQDDALIQRFGEDVTIMTDGDKLLAQKDDYPELSGLQNALFEAIKMIPDFLLIKPELAAMEATAKNGNGARVQKKFWTKMEE